MNERVMFFTEHLHRQLRMNICHRFSPVSIQPKATAPFVILKVKDKVLNIKRSYQEQLDNGETD